MPLLLQVLGASPHLTGADGVTVILPPGKPFAALCLLAFEPGGVSRDDLVTLLWPQASPERGRASMRQALHVVRRALGAEAIEEHGGSVMLVHGVIGTDLDALHAAMAAGDLEACRALWHGGPFAHFSLADAAAFNQWADGLRSRWERRLGEALSQRADAARHAGHAEDALAWVGHALDVRPFDEHAHAARVEMLLELGLLDEAEAALDRARAVVDEPTPGVLDELEGRLRAARHALAAGAPDAGPAPYPSLAFVGRTAEMAQLRSLWRSALSGRPRSMAVLGPAGIGKTRLVEEWTRHTVGPDATVVRAKALDTERSLPLGLAAELAKSLSSRPGAAGMANASLAVLRHLVPTLGNGSAPPPSGSLSEVAVAEALLDLAEAVASESPLVLWLDDLQWADPQSRAVLLRLARSLRAAQVLTVVTCRSGDTDLSAVRTLRAEASAGRFATLELAPLSADEVLEALSLSLDVRPPDEAKGAAARLASASQGNPLFLAELLLRLHAEGRVTEEAGHWVLHAVALVSGDLPLPTSVREILQARLGALPPELHSVLGALAHAPGPVGHEELARRIGAPPPALRGALEALAAHGIVAAPGGASVAGGSDDIQFAHDSLRAIARDLFTAPRRPGLLRRFPRWAVGASGLAAAGMLVAIAVRLWAPETPPLYPGVIYVAEQGAIQRYRVPTRRGGAWDTLPPIPVPVALGNPRLAPGLDGGQAIYGEMNSAAGVPAAVRLGADGSWSRLLEHDGDLNVTGLSPSGRYALLAAADESTGRYRQDLVRYDVATGKAVTLYRPTERAGGTWAVDGASIAVYVRAAVDTMVLLRPDGVELARRPLDVPGLADAPTPCGPTGDRLVAQRWIGEELHLVTFGWDGAEPESRWMVQVPTVFSFRCAPDGQAALNVAKVRGTNRLLVVDLAAGDTLLGPEVGSVTGMGWIPDGVPPVPESLSLAERSVVLGWGESRPVTASVHLAGGGAGDGAGVTWASRDPSVASVREGVLYANGVGATDVVATLQGWITDTMRVRVTGASLKEEALIAEPFQELDSAAWVPFGSPRPEVIEVGDGRALDIRGDGVGADGVFSRRRFDLSRGATLEASFRLPLSRTDRQGVGICLANGDPPDEDPSQIFTPSEQFCFVHPSGELTRFEPASFALSAGPGVLPPRLRTSHLPATSWVRVSLVLAPDGNGRLLLNQEEAARLTWPVQNGPEVEWYILLFGRAADTQLLIRDVVLWEGMRY